MSPAGGHTAPVLVIGATGTTGSRVVRRLVERGAQVRGASRHPGPGGAVFDWSDPTTHAGALDGVERLYLVPPIGDAQPGPVVRPFLERALAGSLRRVVLLSASAVEPAQSGVGALHAMVREIVPQWAVLRPSWFMQNLTGDLPAAQGVRRGRVTTATGEGRVGFVDAEDIAAVATMLLLTDQPPADEYVLTGPQALSWAEVCALAGEVSGHPVEHQSLSVAAIAEMMTGSGIPADFAAMLAGLDEAISHGAEDRTTDTVQRVTGRPPRSMADFLAAHRDLLEPAT